MNEIMNNKLYKYVHYESYVIYIFCKLCKNGFMWTFVYLEEYIMYKNYKCKK